AFDQGVQVILEVQDVAVSQPPTAAGNEVQQAYVDAVNDVLLGRRSAQEAMQAADQEAQAALDRTQE
ncbi:MAG: sugar ABC transporter substrate-binding protein, partial [Actinomycetota bacterium]|nr:sugar ABC transporter substrate-binding protein [Actinomycetota bacterium]